MSDNEVNETQISEDDWAAAMSEQVAPAAAEAQPAKIFEQFSGGTEKSSAMQDYDLILDIPVSLTVELGRTHVHAHALIGIAAQRQHPVHGAHPDHVLVRQPMLAHVLEKTARAVAAVLHLLAVRVVNHIFEIDVRGRGRSHA